MKVLFSRLMFISRKVREEAEIDEVKETDEVELRDVMKVSRESRPWAHSKKMSSMKRTQRRGLRV